MMEGLKRKSNKWPVVFVASAIALVAGLVLSTARAEAASSPLFDVPTSPAVEGGIFFVSLIADDELTDLSGTFENEHLRFYPEPNSKPHRYTALVGVEFGTKTGLTPIEAEGKVQGHAFTRKAMIQIVAGKFPFEILHVPPRTVAPAPGDMPRIEKEREFLKKIYSESVSEKLWDAPVLMPVKFKITSRYGTSRIYNGVKHNSHLGTDFRAPVGTPIQAPLSGRVVVARDLFYTGFTVLLDHGYGLVSFYGHMSKLKVKEGEMARKGDVVGFSGMTGRASGPHLHWGVSLNGVKVDPIVFSKVLQ